MPQRGFTLIEILVGLLILTFIVMTSLAIVFERERRLLFAAETIAAYQALANEVEVQRRVPYELLIPGQSNEFLSESQIIDEFPQLERSVTITETAFGVKTVTLTLRWRGQRSARLSVIRTSTGGDNLW